jgi:hypothetical protein
MKKGIAVVVLMGFVVPSVAFGFTIKAPKPPVINIPAIAAPKAPKAPVLLPLNIAKPKAPTFPAAFPFQ